MRARQLLAAAALVLVAGGCGGDGDASGTATLAPSSVGVRRLVPEVVAEHPHDVDAFTQGLELDGDDLVESTGLLGRSSIRRVEPATGRVLASTALDPDLFGEGVTRLGDRWYQLTWRSNVVVVWDDELQEVERLPYPYEGWGICADGGELVASDGTDVLRVLDPADLAVRREVRVTLDGEPVDQLNELECVDGTVWANVWHESSILGIDLATGAVTDHLDASALVEQVTVADRAEDVLNGIAHDPATGHLYLTGKRWPTVFEVELVAAG